MRLRAAGLVTAVQARDMSIMPLNVSLSMILRAVSRVGDCTAGWVQQETSNTKGGGKQK